MKVLDEIQKLRVVEPPGGNGLRVMVETDSLPISKFVTNEQLIAEERFLAKKETEVERRYTGIRGYLRILHVSGVLGKLALYLYLDQLDMHRTQQIRHGKERLQKARRLTRAAVFGEWLYGIRVAFFHHFMRFVRVIFLGRERNREPIYSADNELEYQYYSY